MEELFLSTQNIDVSPHISDGQQCGGAGAGGIRTINTTHSVGPAGFHTSQLDLTEGHNFSDKSRFFLAIICDRGR
jgi:hypothetical protein